jgi:hypothetical protein
LFCIYVKIPQESYIPLKILLNIPQKGVYGSWCYSIRIRISGSSGVFHGSVIKRRVNKVNKKMPPISGINSVCLMSSPPAADRQKGHGKRGPE